MIFSLIKNKLRYTKLHHFILSFINPKYTKWLYREIKFHKKFLKKNDLIFDIGANRGDKTFIFSKVARKIIAYEPEDKMFSILVNRFTEKNIILKKKLLSDKIKKNNFYIVKDNEAYSSIIKKSHKIFKNIVHGKVIVKKKLSTTLNVEIKKFGIPKYIKIDCEGAEKLILKNINYTVPVISFEVNLPEFFNECKSIIMNFNNKELLKYNVRLNHKYEFFFKKNINYRKCLNFLKDKNFNVEVFVFS